MSLNQRCQAGFHVNHHKKSYLSGFLETDGPNKWRVLYVSMRKPSVKVGLSIAAISRVYIPSISALRLLNPPLIPAYHAIPLVPDLPHHPLLRDPPERYQEVQGTVPKIISDKKKCILVGMTDCFSCLS